MCLTDLQNPGEIGPFPPPRSNPLAVPFALERFHTGYLIDEHGASGVAH